MDIKTARGIAARIWCDFEYSHVPMDARLAEEIAHKLLECAQQAQARQLNGCEVMKCTDYRGGICILDGPCKYNAPSEVYNYCASKLEYRLQTSR